MRKGFGGEPLLSVLVLEGLLPVGRREFEDATPGPTGQQAEQVPEVRPRLDPEQAAARQERDERGVHLGGLVGADEEPVPAADDLAPQLELARVVVQRQAPVVEEPLQRLALIAGVPDRLGERV